VTVFLAPTDGRPPHLRVALSVGCSTSISRSPEACSVSGTHRARQEMAAAGVRPPSAASGVDALTPSQLRVARMAAAGMSNRAIAQALFITIKTVEVHPGAAGPGPPASAYRKVSIPSRTALAEALTPDRTIGTRETTDRGRCAL
jgi:DNA-binding NarL/FixJ family response regulator